ncbi:MAG: hypothetical protein ACLQHF_08685 [Terracidiphilus sp.]
MGASKIFELSLEIAVGLLCMAAGLGLLGWAIKLAAQDAERRGKSPVLVSIACVLFFPWGLVAWILFRPDPIDKGKDGFELENYRVQ